MQRNLKEHNYWTVSDIAWALQKNPKVVLEQVQITHPDGGI